MVVTPKILRHRHAVAVIWALVVAILLPIGEIGKSRFEATGHLDRSDAERVTELLRNRFGSPFAYSVILVLGGLSAIDTSEGARVIGDVAGVISRIPVVAGVMSYVSTGSEFFRGRNGHGTFLIVGLKTDDARRAEGMIARLRSATEALEPALHRSHPEVTLRWTGAAAINADIRRVGDAEVRRAELRAFPLTGAILLLAFGAVVAAAIPLISAIFVVGIATGLAALAAIWTSMSVVLVSVVAMIGLGLSIDYVLLVVSRFREALGAGLSTHEAVLDANRHAGHTVIVSGSAVAIGFISLLFVPISEVRSIGLGGILVAATAMLMATTLLPVVLARLGRGVDWGRFQIGHGGLFAESTRRWACWLAAYPRWVLMLVGAPLALLAWQSIHLKVAVPRGDWLPAEAESVRAIEDLRAMERSSVLQTVRVLVELPSSAPLRSPVGWQAIQRLSQTLAGLPQVAAVHSITTVLGGSEDAGRRLELLPRHMRRSLADPDGRGVLVELVPHEEATVDQVNHLVTHLRNLDADSLSGLPGTRLLVGGLPAFNLDYELAVKTRFLLVVGLVVGLTFLALLIAFRSLLIALKAVVLNLFSVAAAFGAVVLVFQDGHGIEWLGMTAPVGGVFPIIPVLVFATVFGLSMDYEVFLVARVVEAHRGGKDDTAALVEGLTRSGRIITSAAAIMLAVFTAFLLGDFIVIKMLGFALAVAVAIDATFMRLALGPALLRIAGRWNWWPFEHRAATVVPER